MRKRLFVGNLSYDARGLAVRGLFEACGGVDDVRLVTDGESGRPRGYAVVTMTTAADARLAVKKLDGEICALPRSVRICPAIITGMNTSTS